MTGHNRIHSNLYRRQHIGIGLRYMDGDDEAVVRLIIITVQSTSFFPPTLAWENVEVRKVASSAAVPRQIT